MKVDINLLFHRLIKERFFLLAILVSAVGFILVYKVGFDVMLHGAKTVPERMRDYTFPVWGKYPPSMHGFLVFLAPDAIGRHEAYAHHAYGFLGLTYLFYKLEMLLGLSMRGGLAFLQMSLSVAALLYIISASGVLAQSVRARILTLMAVLCFVTMPTFWIPAAKFNYDNTFPLVFPLLLLAAYGVERSKRLFFLSAFLMAVVSPISSLLLGIFLVSICIHLDAGKGKEFFRAGVITCFISLVFYIQPIIVSKLLGFSSKNSGWGFRSGLDGDLTYFSNVLNAIIFPADPRPYYLVLVPTALLVVQILSRFVSSRILVNSERSILFFPSGFYFVLFSNYILTVVLWPQAISIHPYLYDHLLIAPILVCVIFNFSQSDPSLESSQLWFWVLVLFVSFNLQQIAQSGHCAGCYYSPGKVVG